MTDATKTRKVKEAIEAEQRELRWKCESALLVLVASQLKAEAARIMVGSPRQGEDSFVAQARSAWRQASAERDAQVERFRNADAMIKERGK
jgi:hypothetical protein